MSTDQTSVEEATSRPSIGESAPAGAVPTPHQHAAPGADGDPLHKASGGVDVGRVIEVTVDSVGDREVLVHLADGRAGVIARAEFTESVAGGDRVRAALLAREDPKGRVWLSRTWAIKLDGWNHVEEALANRSPLSGKVVKAVKGGFVVNLGARAFLPVSQVTDGAGDSLVGTEIRVTVIEASRDKDRVVVSIRDLQRRESRDHEKEVMRSLEPGKRIDGTIHSTADYGAIVELGGVRGLIPRGELSWGRVTSVDAIVQKGDQVRVQVLDVNRSKKRITLSLRQTSLDPLASVNEGDIVDGTVTKVVEYGAFMQIGDSQLEGLAHVSELSDAQSYDARELVIPGEVLRTKVIEIDRRKRRIALSVLQAM